MRFVDAPRRASGAEQFVNATEHIAGTAAGAAQADEYNAAAQALAEQRGSHSLGQQFRIKTAE